MGGKKPDLTFFSYSHRKTTQGGKEGKDGTSTESRCSGKGRAEKNFHTA